MKKTVYRVLVCAMSIMMLLISSASLAENAIDVIMNVGTTHAFTDEAVPEKDLKTILDAGLIAPSALNLQPWFFAVVTDQEVMKEIAGGEAGEPASDKAGSPPNADVGDSPVAIVIYSDGKSSPVADFDCGLAAQNMYIAAASLGYGVKYVASPTVTLNGDKHDELCEKLGVPTGLKAVTVLLIGRKDGTVDGATGATTRDPMEKKVSFIK